MSILSIINEFLPSQWGIVRLCLVVLSIQNTCNMILLNRNLSCALFNCLIILIIIIIIIVINMSVVINVNIN